MGKGQILSNVSNLFQSIHQILEPKENSHLLLNVMPSIHLQEYSVQVCVYWHARGGRGGGGVREPPPPPPQIKGSASIKNYFSV